MTEVIEAPVAETVHSLEETEKTIYGHAFNHGYVVTRDQTRKGQTKQPETVGRNWDLRFYKGGRRRDR